MEYSIGQAAEATGMTAPTLRYYENEGLLTARRHPSGRRYYSDDDLLWLQFIHHMRSTDMPVADLSRYVSLRRRGVEGAEGELLEIMRKHERHLTEKLAHYQTNLDLVRHKISMYEDQLKGRDADLFELYKECRCDDKAGVPGESPQCGSDSADVSSRDAQLLQTGESRGSSAL
ncbi:MAG: MerR family transcriptional regulator [Bifidobacterium sp.]|uniref:MerR family transcriptional regulator n=1 Tax=Bifidobacterium fermentum TaxID=3059035 RepID=A0AB39UMA0_9BIFI